MKYIKKFFESGEIPEDFKYCFDNLGDMSGFYLEHKAFDYSLELKHTDDCFEYTYDILDEIQSSMDRAKDLNLRFSRSFVTPSESKYMSSVVCPRKSALEIDAMDYWLGEEFPDPNKIFFTKYPAYRKCWLDKHPITEASVMRNGREKRMSIEYPLSQEDILYTTSLKSISFLFF